MAARAENNFSASALKAVITKYGKRIKCITTTNTKILCNTPSFNLPYLDTDNITTFDADGYDMLECRMRDSFSRKEYTSLIRIGDITSIQITDSEHETIDPFKC